MDIIIDKYKGFVEKDKDLKELYKLLNNLNLDR